LRIRAEALEGSRAGAPSDADEAVVHHLSLVVVLAGDDADVRAAAGPLLLAARLDEATVGGHREERVAILDGHARVGGGGRGGRSAVGGGGGARARRGGVAERLVDDLKDRDAEGARLAAASLGGGEHVAAAQDEGDSLRLHGGGEEPTLLVRHANELGAHPELLEHRHVERDEAAGATAREREWRKRSGRRPRRRDHEMLLLVFHVL